MNFAGFPPQISLGGIFFVTTLPAAIIEFSPIVKGFVMMELAPINTPSII